EWWSGLEEWGRGVLELDGKKVTGVLQYPFKTGEKTVFLALVTETAFDFSGLHHASRFCLPPEYVHSQVSLADHVTNTDIISEDTRINLVNKNPSTHAGNSRQQPVFKGNSSATRNNSVNNNSSIHVGTSR
nr:hypothetical protein [Tanacetum cinerariifolium]